MARMKIEVQAARAAKHGLSLHDRLVGYLPRYAPYAARLPWLFNLRDALRRCGEAVGGDRRLSARSAACRNGARDIYRDRADWATTARKPTAPPREVVLFADTFNRYFERENLDAALERAHRRRLPRACGAAGRRRRAAAVLRPHLPRRSARSMRRGREMRAHARGARALRRARRAGDRAGAELPAELPRRGAGAAQGRRRGRARRARAAVRGIPRARARRQAGSICRSARCRRRRCCTAIATRRRSTPWARSKACCGSIPELDVETVESSCCGMAGSLRLRRGHHRRVARDGRTVAAARGAQGRRPTR